jgi:hypothetical protein
MLKLESHGISGGLLKWIEDFSSKRTQMVKTLNCILDKVHVTSGVLQAVHGPKLFLQFINGIWDVVADRDQNFSMKLFADDA